MSGTTYTGTTEILTQLETDTTFRAWCLSTFGVTLDQGDHLNTTRADAEHLTPKWSAPEDWDQWVWNKPVHLFLVPRTQVPDYDSGCHTFLTANYTAFVRFDTSATIESMSDFIDRFRDCIRDLDEDAIDLYQNGEVEPMFLENSFPAVTINFSVRLKQSEDD